MNLVASLIKLMFGTKSEKDRKLIAPYVEKILAIYPSSSNFPTTSYVRAAPRSKRPSPTISARTSSRSPI